MKLMTSAEFRWIRMQYGLTMTEAAKYLRVSRRTIECIEAGQMMFKQRYAARLEQGIGTQWYKALRAAYEEVHQQEQATEAAARERRLNQSQQEDQDGDDTDERA